MEQRPMYTEIGKDLNEGDMLKAVMESVSKIKNFKFDAASVGFETITINDNVLKIVSNIKYPEGLSFEESKRMLLEESQNIMKLLGFITPEISFYGILIFISLFAFLQLFYLVPSKPCYYTILAGSAVIALNYILFSSPNIADFLAIFTFAAMLVLMILSRTVFLYSWGILFLLFSSFSLVSNLSQGNYINFLFLLASMISFLLLFFHKRWVGKIKSKVGRAVALQGLFIVFLLVTFSSLMGPVRVVLDLLKTNVSTLENSVRNMKSASDLNGSGFIRLETSIDMDSDTVKVLGGSIYHMIKAVSPFFKVVSILTGFTMGTILHLVREEYIFPKGSLF